MELALGSSELLLRESARALLNKTMTHDTLTALEGDKEGYSRELWQQAASLGWCELAFIDQLSSEAGPLALMAALLSEFGRAAAPGPFFQTAAAVGFAVSRLGTTEAAKRLSGLIRTGQVKAALLVPTTPASALTGTLTSGRLSLSGGPFIVEWGAIVDVFVSQASQRLVVIPSNVVGIGIEPLRSLDNERLARVTFNEVEVAVTDATLGTFLNLAEWEQSIELVGLLRAMEMIGGMERVIEMTLEHVKNRHQFGRPIGSFQAVQHMCADMRVVADGAWLAVGDALSRAEAGLDFGHMAAVACYFTGRAAEEVTVRAAQLHGGVGYIRDHLLHFFFRRAKAQQLRLGSDSDQLRKVARLFGSLGREPGKVERMVQIAPESPASRRDNHQT